MSKLTRQRKREIREQVRLDARDHLQKMELASEALESLSDEELAYAQKFKLDLAEGLVIKEKEVADA